MEGEKDIIINYLQCAQNTNSLFLVLPIISCTPQRADKVARQSEFLSYYAYEVGLGRNRRKRNRSGVADYY